MESILPCPVNGQSMSIPAVALIDWYDRTRRDLPWRAPETTPWQIMVSEFMLQQTPVARVAPVWTDWIHRWPTASATAAAGSAEVLRAWGKLGYPRRAKRLHECATVIAVEHDDVVPGDVETLLGLPGVGAYTARAVACFAYGKRVPVVDTNVRRVVARAVDGRADAGSPSTVRDHAAVESLLPENPAAAVFSAALMELGATVCTARSPKCGVCPLIRCAWRDAGFPAGEPVSRRVQPYAGTDRQVRGKLLDVLRATSGPVQRSRLDVVWPADPAQRDRALDSLLVDGLVEQTPDGRFALCGEGEN